MELRVLYYNIEAKDKVKVSDFKGAKLKCWVLAESESDATFKVINLTENDEWILLDLIGHHIVNESSYAEIDPEKVFVMEAFNKGFSYRIEL